MKVGFVSLGCSKNLVDTEKTIDLFKKHGYDIVNNPKEAEIIVINTCGFIEAAKEEAINTILEMAEYKRENCKYIIAMGCLVQRYRDELEKSLPEVDLFIKYSEYDTIWSQIDNLINKDIIHEKEEDIPFNKLKDRVITTGENFAYIKIADGCNYHCGYCIIPQLRGAYHSRTIENIVEEAKELVKKGVTEIDLIAQDTTSYGIDIYGKPSLAKLLEELNKIEGLGWIRIMYAYPTQMNDELIDAIARLDKVAKYVDIPLQHYSKKILEAMRRPVSDYKELIKKLRDRIPGIAIRTAFIVGYPGETEADFQELYEFVKFARFDRMGVFEYSREKNTTSYSMQNQVPKKLKHKRYKELMSLQQQISYEINQTYIGKTIPCMVESFTDDGVIIMRSEHDAPEIDGLVYAKSEKPVVPGDIEQVLIDNADEYDLFGTIV